jgi:hypothetical protein
MIAALLVFILIAVVFPGLVRGFFFLVGVMLLYGMLTGGASAQSRPLCQLRAYNGASYFLTWAPCPPPAAPPKPIVIYPTSPTSAEIPDYDVNRSCSLYHAWAQAAKDYCIRTEQDNYDLIKLLWPNTSTAVKMAAIKQLNHIIEIATPGNLQMISMPYTLLSGYLADEMQKERIAAAPKTFQK